MIKDLERAKQICGKIRFEKDLQQVSKEDSAFYLNGLADFANETGLLISKELTPVLYDNLEGVYKKLKIPSKRIKAFVYASPEIQAQCFLGSAKKCIIRFSSALIDILEPKEFCFVAGHELGHFLLEHGNTKLNNDVNSLEFSRQQRAQEISADRVGYLVSDSLDYSVKALMKSISGLNDEYLRFDISKFLEQLKKPSQNLFNRKQYSSHPSILFRCRALLWLSMEVSTIEDVLQLSKKEKKRIDKKISSDVEKYISGSKDIIQKVRDNVEMWTFCSKIVRDNKFDKKEQELFANKFGNKKLEKLINLLKYSTTDEIKNLVIEKLKSAKADLKSAIPTDYEKEIKNINNQYSNLLND